MVTLEGCLTTWVASEGIETTAMTESTPKVSVASLRERRADGPLLESILWRALRVNVMDLTSA